MFITVSCRELAMETRPAKLRVVVRKGGPPGSVGQRKPPASYWVKPMRRVAFRVAQAPD
jgi:hypothetical protein